VITFFENRRNSTKDSNIEFDGNLTKKQEIITQIIELTKKGEGLEESKLSSLVAEFNAIGFVPRKKYQRDPG